MKILIKKEFIVEEFGEILVYEEGKIYEIAESNGHAAFFIGLGNEHVEKGDTYIDPRMANKKLAKFETDALDKIAKRKAIFDKKNKPAVIAEQKRKALKIKEDEKLQALAAVEENKDLENQEDLEEDITVNENLSNEETVNEELPKNLL